MVYWEGMCNIKRHVHTVTSSCTPRWHSPHHLTLYVFEIRYVSCSGVGAVGPLVFGASKAFGEAFGKVGGVLKQLADLAETFHYNKKTFEALKTRCLANRETILNLQRTLPYSEGSDQTMKNLNA